MKTKKILLSMLLCLALCAPFAGCGQSEPPAGEGTVTEQPPKEDPPKEDPPKEDPPKEDPPKEETKVDDLDHYDLDKYLEPIFEGDHVYNETAMLLLDEEGKLAPIQMYYPITEIVSVRNFALDTLFKAGKDYVLKDGNIEVPAGSALYSVACPHEYYYTDTYINTGEWWPEADGEGGQMQTEAQNGDPGLTRYQIAVTYRHESKWQGEVPAGKSAKLPMTDSKLLNGEAMKIVCMGDSISAGWAASGYSPVNMSPHMPQYFDLVTDCLKETDQAIEAVNLSVSGQTSQWAAGAAQIKTISKEQPDLVILAFGMNDGANKGTNATAFQRNIKRVIDEVRATCPDTEFLLVSTMLPNAEVGFTAGTSILQQHKSYAGALLQLEEEYEGVAAADVTAVHSKLLNRKTFRDMSSNNINHPNDFMHRVYAQVILRTLSMK